MLFLPSGQRSSGIAAWRGRYAELRMATSYRIRYRRSGVASTRFRLPCVRSVRPLHAIMKRATGAFRLLARQSGIAGAFLLG